MERGRHKPMLHDPQRYQREIANRDARIRVMIDLLLVSLAIIIVLASMLIVITRAHGSASCMTKAEARSHWPRSHIWWHGPNRCWDNNSAHSIRYNGHRLAPDILPVHAEVKQPSNVQVQGRTASLDRAGPPRAQVAGTIKQLDANGSNLTPYDEVMEKAQPPDECCWPPLDERSFKSRWDDVPELWLMKQ